jgi:FG-GAP-like repeat
MRGGPVGARALGTIAGWHYTTGNVVWNAASEGIAEVGTGNLTAALVVGDFNQDGKADLAVTVFQEAEAFILLGNGNGTFALQPTPLKTGTGPASIAAGDFNGDGLPDLAVANSGSNNVSVFVNSLKTSATATLTGVTITGSGNQSVQAKDPGAASFGGSNSNALSLPPN